MTVLENPASRAGVDSFRIIRHDFINIVEVITLVMSNELEIFLYFIIYIILHPWLEQLFPLFSVYSEVCVVWFPIVIINKRQVEPVRMIVFPKYISSVVSHPKLWDWWRSQARHLRNNKWTVRKTQTPGLYFCSIQF